MKAKPARTRNRLGRVPGRKGLTLVELLLVTVFVGILAAVALPRLDSARRRAHLSSITQDFRNLGAAQERYYQLNFSYAVNLADIDFQTTPGVQLNVTEATPAGWAAVGTHEALEARMGCAIYIGNAAAPALPNGQPLTVNPGTPECTQ